MDIVVILYFFIYVTFIVVIFNFLEYFQSMVGCGTCGYRGLTIISR